MSQTWVSNGPWNLKQKNSNSRMTFWNKNQSFAPDNMGSRVTQELVIVKTPGLTRAPKVCDALETRSPSFVGVRSSTFDRNQVCYLTLTSITFLDFSCTMFTFEAKGKNIYIFGKSQLWVGYLRWKKVRKNLKTQKSKIQKLSFVQDLTAAKIWASNSFWARRKVAV